MNKFSKDFEKEMSSFSLSNHIAAPKHKSKQAREREAKWPEFSDQHICLPYGWKLIGLPLTMVLLSGSFLFYAV